MYLNFSEFHGLTQQYLLIQTNYFYTPAAVCSIQHCWADQECWPLISMMGHCHPCSSNSYLPLPSQVA